MKPLNYSLSVWITSILLGPFVYYLLHFITEHNYPQYLGYLLIYSFFFSLPSVILFTIIVLLTRSISTSQLNRKLALSVAGIILTATPLYLLDSGRQILNYSIAYSSIIVVGVWIYPLSLPVRET
jgi:chromate transport protein ChrA